MAQKLERCSMSWRPSATASFKTERSDKKVGTGPLERLAHQPAETRLETPENILSHYLHLAIQKLEKCSMSLRPSATTSSKTGRSDKEVGSGPLERFAHQPAEARLETPENILSHYLQLAVQMPEDRANGAEAGEVFYEFATFCDGQLQNEALGQGASGGRVGRA